MQVLHSGALGPLLAVSIRFIVGLLASAFAVWLALRIYPGRQSRESFGGALLTAFIGAAIFWLFSAINIPLGTLIALVLWLYALKKLQGVGWLGAALLAVLIYLINAVLGIFLPTVL